MSNFLTKKMGPLPVWGYGAIAGGGLLLLKKKSGSGGGGNPNAMDPNQPNGMPGGPNTTGASQAFMYGGSGNIDQTFGGGSLGMYSWPYAGGGNQFVNLFRHPFGDSWRHGGHGYPFHAFDRQPFFNFGGLFGHDGGFHPFGGGGFGGRGQGFGGGDGDRGRSWASDPFQAGGSPSGNRGGSSPGARWTDNNASSPGNHVR